MRKLLIISYYWPPSGGSGVQRWLYFVKYLRECGWEPVIYTVENGEFPFIDNGLLSMVPNGVEVIRRRIWEPYSFFKKLRGGSHAVDPTIMNKSKDASWFHKLSIWIRGNIFIPDPRVFWVKPSVQYLSAYLKKHPVELIVSTGPPHSMHLIAKHLRQKLNIAWLADFRDPWTQIFYFETLHLNRLSRFIHSKLEKSVLQQADVVVTVSRSCKDDLESICGRKVEVITNGFEPFENRNLIKPNQDRIVLLYAGVLTQDRNPELLWNALKEYVVENPDIQQRLEIRFIGNVDPYVVQSARSMNAFKVNHMLPMSHEELQNHLWEADALMLIGVPGNKGVVTGKFFEYLFLKKPILSVSPPDSDLVEMLIQTQTGYNADFIDQVGLRNAVDQIFDTIIHKNFKPNEPVISSYSRRNLTHQMAEFMNTAVEQFKSKGPQ